MTSHHLASDGSTHLRRRLGLALGPQTASHIFEFGAALVSFDKTFVQRASVSSVSGVSVRE
jgi:hypothetical protein